MTLTTVLCVSFLLSAASLSFPCDTSPSADIWEWIQGNITGTLYLPSSPEWDDVSHQWNLIYSRKPLAVVYAHTKQDVIQIVSIAHAQFVCIVPRSSGHSYSAQAVLDGRLVLDVSYLNQTSFDAQTKTLSVGPGTTLFMLVDVCEENNVFTTWGACGDVRLGGYLQGGGEGNGQRVTGVGIDNVLSYDLVLANGTVLNGISNNFQQEVFWGLRGGGGPGGNFGIVTGIKILPQSIFPNYATILYFTLSFDQEDALEASVRFFEPSPVAFGGGLWFVVDGTVRITGWWLGNQTEGRTFLQNLTTNLKPTNVSIESITLFEATRRDFVAAQTPKSVYYSGAHSLYSKKGPERHDLQSILSYVQTARPLKPEEGGFFLAVFLTGGKTNIVGRPATAFVHRNSVFNFEIGISLSDPSLEDQYTKWGDAFYAKIGPIFSDWGADDFEVYQNNADFTLKNWSFHYYMENYPRLQGVKALCDPENYFSFPQSIELP